MIVLIVESKKSDTNELIYKAEIDLENELWLPAGRRLGRRDS